MKVQVSFRSMSTSAGQVKNGDIVDLPEAEVQKILKMKPKALIVIQEEPKPAAKPAAKPKAKAKKSVKPIH